MQLQDTFALVYNIPYRRERAWPSGFVQQNKGILHTTFARARTRPKGLCGR